MPKIAMILLLVWFLVGLVSSLWYYIRVEKQIVVVDLVLILVQTVCGPVTSIIFLSQYTNSLRFDRIIWQSKSKKQS
jgi:hypothetical protein